MTAGSKEDLSSGLEGWIKDTRRVKEGLERPEVGLSVGRLDIEQIEVPPPRLPASGGDHMERLKRSIQNAGQLQPIVVRRRNDGFELVSGHGRLDAMKELGESDVLAVVHDELSDDEARNLYISDNLGRLRSDPAVLVDLIAAVGVGELRGWGLPEDLLERLKPLTHASEALREALRQHQLNEEQALALVDAPDTLLVEALGEGWTAAEIAQRAERHRLEHLAESNEEEVLTALSHELQDLAERLAIIRQQLPAEALERLAPQLAEITPPVVSDGTPEAREPIPSEPPLEPQATPTPANLPVVPLSDENFDDEVLNSSAPVIVLLHIDGHFGSPEAYESLCRVHEKFNHNVKICALDAATSDAPVVPQIIRVGRGFLEKNLPRMQIYQGGQKLRELENPDGADELLATLEDALQG